MSKNRSEYNAKYYIEHKEKIIARKKRAYQLNKEVINERNKQWKKDNRDYWNAYMREWRRKKKLDKKEQA